VRLHCLDYRHHEGVRMALQLKDLTDDEQLALVALLKAVAEADQYVTEGEATQLRRVIAAIGRKAYETAAEESDRRFHDKAELREFLSTITRQEACELIYETALEVALADAPVPAETEILDWLKGIWKITVRIVKD
jgi:uncharacterized tellurite resistance protein B-like protein